MEKIKEIKIESVEEMLIRISREWNGEENEVEDEK